GAREVRVGEGVEVLAGAQDLLAHRIQVQKRLEVGEVEPGAQLVGVAPGQVEAVLLRQPERHLRLERPLEMKVQLGRHPHGASMPSRRCRCVCRVPRTRRGSPVAWCARARPARWPDTDRRAGQNGQVSSSSSAVVIGAGVAGASVAFALARRGVAVTVVDDGAAGQATVAGAGIVAPWLSSSTGRFYDLYAAGGAFYPRLLDLLGEAGVTPPDYRRTGSLAVHHDPDVLAAAEANVRERVAAAGAVAGRVERVDTGQLRDLFPPLAEDLSGFFLTGGGRVDGRTLRDALLAAAARAGARRMSGAVHLATVGEAVTAEVNTTPLEADAVVVTAGAWTADLLARAGVRVPVAPQRGQ